MHITLTLFAFDESTFHKGYNYGYCCKHHNTTLFSVYFVLKFGLASFRSLPVVYMIMQSFLISSTTFLYRASCLNIFILLLVFL